MNYYIKKLGSGFRRLYDRLYTSWKVHETGTHFTAPLEYDEKIFFLRFRSIFTGDNLIVYDIGAASGVLSRCVTKLPNVAAVHAFEPVASAFTELTKHTQQYPKIERHNVAIGDENRDMDIWVTPNWPDSSSLLPMQALHKDEIQYATFENRPEKVHVVRLDDYVREHSLPLPDVIKVDVQGYEDRVLQGGEATIKQASIVILEMSFVSLYEGSPLFDDIYRKMSELNFQLIGFGGELRGESGRYLQTDGIFQNLERMKTNV